MWKKRNAERINLNLPVSILAGFNSATEGHILRTKDISRDGVFIISEAQLSIGEDVLVKMLLPSGKKVVAKGMVWRTAEDGVAIKFDSPCHELEEEFGSNLTRTGHYKAKLNTE